jgi:predicted Zn-dependent protease
MPRASRYLAAILAGIVVGGGAVATDQVLDERERKIVASFLRANDLVREGKPADSVHLYRRIVRDRPDFDLAYRHLGVALAELGRHQEARAAYLSYLERTNDEVDAARVRALLE